jgi:hypothetical protein
VDILDFPPEERLILSVVTYDDTEYYFVRYDRNNGRAKSRRVPQSYAIVPVLLQVDEDDAGTVASLQRLVKASFLNGNSSRAGSYKASVLAAALLREQKFAQIVEENGVNLANFRLSQGFLDSHDMDTSAVVVVGSEDDLTALCEEYNSVRPDFPVISDTEGDTASALLFLSFDTIELMRSSPDEVDAIFEECLRDFEHINQCSVADKNCSVSFNMNHLINDAAITEKRSQLGDGVIVGISHYVDGLVGKPLGGKRDLGETPLQCALRQTQEEGDLSIADNPCYRPIWHQQSMINFYYYYYST